MDPVTRCCLAVLLGVLLAPDVSGAASWWALAAFGFGLAAVPGGRLGGWRGVPCAVAVGLACGRSLPEGPVLHGEVSIVGVRVGAPNGRSGDVEVARWVAPGKEWVPTHGRVRVAFPEIAPPAGVPVVVLGNARRVPPVLPGAPDPVRAAALAGIATQVRAVRFRRLDGWVKPEPPPDPTGVLRAIALGDRSALSPEDDRTFRRTGTAHLLSVSGFHVGAAAALVTGVALWGARLVAVWRPVGVPSHVPIAVGVVAGWVYAYAAGGPVPALRAAALLSLAAVGTLAGRGVAPIPLLAIVAVVLAVLDPSSPATATYQLSFGAMVGLVLVVPRLARWVPPDLPRIVTWFTHALFATIGATLGTLPAIAWWFQEVAPLSPIANLIALPIVSIAIVPLSTLACFGPAPLDAWGGWLGTPVCELLLAVLRWCEVDPWTPAVGPVGALSLVGALLVALRRPVVGVVAVVAILVWPPSRPDHLRLTVLDVGQGDALLLEFQRGERWLVDGGAHRTAVVAWLRRQRIRHLDAVVATHADVDHSGGLAAVVRTLDVRQIWATDVHPDLAAAATERGVPIVPPLGALHPWPQDPTTGNDASTVLAVGPMLLLGDAERAAEVRVSARLPGSFPILKVAHHGSRTSTTPALLEAARPVLAIVSVGADNPYGHPHPDVLARLAAYGVPVLRTDRDGTITVDLADGVITVRARRSDTSLEVRCRSTCRSPAR